MTQTTLTRDEVIRRGQVCYNEKIRPEVEPEHIGKYSILNIETGEYEMDMDDVAASKRARTRFPHATLFTLRIGYPAAYRLGSPLPTEAPLVTLLCTSSPSLS